MRIDDSHYIDEAGILRGVPYGFISTPDKRRYIPNTNTNLSVYSSKAQQNRNQLLKEGAQGVLSFCQTYDTDYANSNVCFDLSYVNSSNTITSGIKARIKEKYYIDNSGIIAYAPEGSYVSANKRSYQFYSTNTNSLNYEFARAYNGQNLDINYHSDPTQDRNADNIPSSAGKMWVRSADGSLKQVPFKDVSNNTSYYEPGTYPFGPSSYVPVYEESVYLSKLTNQPTIAPYTSANEKKGFCHELKSSKYRLEEKCNTLDKDSCASTDCCVLLGGTKCVTGNSSGPAIKANYSDFMVLNRDYYYFKGKCYGNCPR